MLSTLLQYSFMLCGYPLARWFLPHISSREHAIAVHLTIGIAFCSFFFGQKMLLAFLMIFMGYFILDKDPKLVFTISFIMNSVIHCIQFCWSSHHNVSNLTMIVFYKIVATSFNLDDGRKIKSHDEDHLTENQRSLHITKKPTFFEWVAYCFTPFGSISNSFYEFKFFDRLLEIGTKQQTVSDTSKAKAKDRLIRSFIHGFIYFTFRHSFQFSFYQTESFHSFNIITRIFFVLLLSLTIFSKDFMFWNVVDAGLYEAGFADYGIEPENDFTSLTFEYLLSMKTIEEWSFIFNHTNEIFWLKYFTSRGGGIGLFETIHKTIYKGFWGGIMLASFEKSMFLSAERVLHAILPICTKSLWPAYIFSQAMMALNRTSMRFKTTYTFFYMNYIIYFISWLLSALIIINRERNTEKNAEKIRQRRRERIRQRNRERNRQRNRLNFESSIKNLVDSKYGNVYGVLRFSIMWNDDGTWDKNDLDAHCIEPTGNEIMYSNDINEMTGGILDVDIIDPNQGMPACENITWDDINMMESGQYKFFVHQFSYRNGHSGFRAEIEFDNQIFYYDYRETLSQGTNVNVAYVTLHNGTFSIQHCLPVQRVQKVDQKKTE